MKPDQNQSFAIGSCTPEQLRLMINLACRAFRDEAKMQTKASELQRMLRLIRGALDAVLQPSLATDCDGEPWK